MSITLNAGGQTYLLANNNPSSPYGSASFSANVVTDGQPFDPPMGEFSWGGATQIGSTAINFGADFYALGDASLLKNLTNLNTYNLNGLSSVGIGITPPDAVVGGNIVLGGNSLTSISLVATPEPNTLTIFSALGLAGVIFRRRRVQS